MNKSFPIVKEEFLNDSSAYKTGEIFFFFFSTALLHNTCFTVLFSSIYIQ